MSFLQNYRVWTEGDECPEVFHVWSGIMALSSIVSRKVWFDLGRIRIFPNLYIILVAPPGDRKSSAMVEAQNLMRDVQDVAFSADCASKEQICRQLAQTERVFVPDETGEPVTYHPITICVEELSEFLGVSQGGMINFLTDVYVKNYYEYKTKNQGNDIIVGPFVNLFACATPDWIAARLRDDIISGGFSRRVLFVYSEDWKLIPIPKRQPHQIAAKEELLKRAQEIKKLGGQLTWDSEVEKFYSEWYVGQKPVVDASLRGYYRSRHIQMLKIAILISISESNTLKIELNHLQLAIALLEEIEKSLPKVFASMGRNVLNAVGNKMLGLIMMSGGIITERKYKMLLNKEADVNEGYQVTRYLLDSELMLELKKVVGEKTTVYYYLPEKRDDVLKLVEQLGGSNPSPLNHQSSSASTTPSTTVAPVPPSSASTAAASDTSEPR